MSPYKSKKKMRCLGWNVKYVGSLFMRNNEGLNWKPDHVQISTYSKFFWRLKVKWKNVPIGISIKLREIQLTDDGNPQGTWFTFSLQNNLVVCTWFEKNIFAIFSQLKKFASHPFLDICVWTFEYKRKRDLDQFFD